jgi:3-(3-hydroxy-phenyl)propionate hydroxylase
MTNETDVVIIGGGPVGVALSIALKGQGLESVVLEKESDIYHLPRAIGMDEEIQRSVGTILDLDEEMQALLTPLTSAQFVDADHNRILGFDVPDDFVGRLGYAPMGMYYQPNLDAMLRDTAVARGVDLRVSTECVDLVDRGDGVDAVLADGSTVSARWAVGCDGAASPTRKRLGITPIDQGFDQHWVVIDMEWLGDEADLREGGATQICDPQRPGTFVPGDKWHRRWEFQGLPGESAEELTTDDKVWELVAPWMTPDQGRIIRAVSYRFHAVVADRMRDGNIFLAGDSAHQMPPFNGQGLNSGLRDALNLAWKMGMVARGVAADALLDTYDEERRPHAAQVVAHAVDTGRLIDHLSGKDVDADESAGYGGRDFPKVDGGLFFGEGVFVGQPATHVRDAPGSSDARFGSGFAVLVADESLVVPEMWAAIGASIVPVGSDEIGGHGASVVRPDRLVCAAVDDQAGLDAATAHVLGRMGISAESP